MEEELTQVTNIKNPSEWCVTQVKNKSGALVWFGLPSLITPAKAPEMEVLHVKNIRGQKYRKVTQLKSEMLIIQAKAPEENVTKVKSTKKV